MQLECGKFTGNGTSLDITLKTKRIPDLLYIKIDSGRYGRYKHILQASDISTRFNSATSDSTGVTALYEGGFSVGNSSDVNQSAIETGYVAFFDDDNNDFEVGTYEGDGNATQVISIEQGFDAEIVFIFDDSGNAIHRSAADSNARLFTNSGAQTTHITAIGTGTFTVGSSLNVSSTTYYYAVFKKVVGKNGSGTYSGSASGQTINFSDASNGVAEYMIVTNQSSSRVQPARADKDYLFNEPNETHSYFTEAWGAYNEILEFNRGSFSVGTSRDANWLGDTYAYFWLSSNPKTDTALPVAVPGRQNAVNINPDFIDLSNPINWDHPLARHLKHLWLAIPQYNGGLTFIDLCDPASYGTLTNMDGSNWVQLSENGQFAGLQFDGATENVDFTGKANLPTVYTESFTSAHIFRKTDSSSGASKIINNAGASFGYVGGLGWTDSAGRGFEIAVPAYGGTSTSVASVEIAGTPHTTFDNLWHFVGFDYPGGNVGGTAVNANIIKFIVDGTQYDGAAGSGVGNLNFYRIGGRGSTAGFPGIIACHALWIPAIGPELLAEFEVEAEAGYPNLLNRIPSLPFTYSFNLTPPVVIPWQGNVANQNPDFIDLSNPIASHGLNDGLVSWFLAVPSQMGTNTWVDLVGNNDGTLTNMDPSTDWVIDNEDGRWGSLDFDGSDDYVTDDVVVIDDFPFSFGGWFAPDAVEGSFINFSNSSQTFRYLRISTVTPNSLYFQISDGAGTTNVIATAAWTAGEWVHVFAVSVADNLHRIYVNGEHKASSSNTRTFPVLNVFNLGAQNHGGTFRNYLNGKIQDARVYSRALSATEVQELYNESRTYYPNLLNRIPSLLPVAVSEAAGGAYSLTVDSQSITVTGTDASLLYDRILSVDSQAITITGTAANLNKGFTLVVDSQAITITGTAVGVLFNRSLSADNQAITVTGTATSLNKGFTLQGDSQTLTISGTAASTLYNRSVPVESQAITVTGTEANTTFSRSISADTQAITVTGTAATPLYNRALSADSGTVTIAGQIVTLTLSGVGSYSLDADGAVVTVTGTAASLLLDRVLNADTDSLNVTGTAASVLYGRSLSASGGTLTITGTDASTLFNRSISAGFGTLTVAGTAANFTYSGDLGVYINEIEVELDVEDTVLPSLTVTESVLVSVE